MWMSMCSFALPFEETFVFQCKHRSAMFLLDRGEQSWLVRILMDFPVPRSLHSLPALCQVRPYLFHHDSFLGFTKNCDKLVVLSSQGLFMSNVQITVEKTATRSQWNTITLT